MLYTNVFIKIRFCRRFEPSPGVERVATLRLLFGSFCRTQKEHIRSPSENTEAFRLRRSGCDPLQISRISMSKGQSTATACSLLAMRPMGLMAKRKRQKEHIRSPLENIEAFRLRRSGCDPLQYSRYEFAKPQVSKSREIALQNLKIMIARQPRCNTRAMSLQSFKSQNLAK